MIRAGDAIADLLQESRKTALRLAETRAKVEVEACPQCTLQTSSECRFRSSDWCRLQGDIEADRIRREHALALTRSGVPKRFHEQILWGRLRSTTALRAAHELADLGTGMLVLIGRPGCGKSLAAGVVVARLGGYFIAAHDLARPIENLELLRRWKRAKALVIDDVGDEHSPGGLAAGVIRELVRSREHAMLPTVITTNLSSSALLERYGDRFMSRARSETPGLVLCADEDLRKEVAP